MDGAYTAGLRIAYSNQQSTNDKISFLILKSNKDKKNWFSPLLTSNCYWHLQWATYYTEALDEID